MMKISRAHRILIFDSGIGGLSISDEIQALLPNVAMVYVADNRTYPYGTLSEQALIDRMVNLFPNLIERFQPEAIVIACNSASTLVLEHLRKTTAIPVIGVVPAIKPAAQRTENRVIGLLATPGTVRRAYTDRLVSDFANHCQVIKIGSRELVDEAEKKLRGHNVNQSVLRAALQPFLAEPTLDQVVLGCTHFPFLKSELQAILGEKVQLIDSGEAIARRTRYILSSLSQHPPQTSSSADDQSLHHFIFTKDHLSAHELVPHLVKHGYQQVEFIDQ